ncbi:MAG: HAD hydrolase family protein [bacterium]|nr:HAD hydrolase family protein [bacterium]MBK8129974.1 HAD hydrolase family protein [bacterium]
MNNRLIEVALAFRPDLPEELVARLQKVKILLVDVDGVLTNGTIYFSDDLQESKGFSTRDGLVLGRVSRYGLLTGAISGRDSAATRARLTALRFNEIYLGHLSKWPVVEEILAKHGLSPQDAAYIGDDLIDLPPLSRVGLSVAPGDAHPALQAGVDVVLNNPGGQGCVREFIELWLWANGKWEEFIRSFEDFAK